MLRNASDMPPELRALLESMQGGPAIGLGLLFGFFVMLFVSTLFGMLGGLFGALMFRKNAAARRSARRFRRQASDAGRAVRRTAKAGLHSVSHRCSR